MDIKNVENVGKDPFVVRVTVFLNQGVLDVQGRTIDNALSSRYETVFYGCKVGKVIELTVCPIAGWQDLLKEVCDSLLSNPVMEFYRVEVL